MTILLILLACWLLALILIVGLCMAARLGDREQLLQRREARAAEASRVRGWEPDGDRALTARTLRRPASRVSQHSNKAA